MTSDLPRSLAHAALLLTPFVAAASAYGDEKTKPSKDDVHVRLFFAVGEYRPVRDAKGRMKRPKLLDVAPMLLAIRKDDGDAKTDWVKGKKKDTMLHVAAPADVVGPEITLTPKDLVGGQMELTAEDPEAPAAPFTNVPLKPGSSTLVCFYQIPGARWQPPKTLLVDVSPEKIPAGSRVVVNLSGMPSFVAIGPDSKPIQVPAGESRTLPPLEGDKVKLRVATRSGAAYRVVTNREMENAPGTSTLLVLSETNPVINAGSPLRVIITPLESLAPKITAAARR